MARVRLGELSIEWRLAGLAVDPIAPVLPLPPAAVPEPAANPARPADVVIDARSVPEPTASPADAGAVPVLFHGTTQCFRDGDGLVLWDGSSALSVSADGRSIEARVHASSLSRAFHFSSVTVTMALLLALRARGHYHLHAGAAVWPDAGTWLVPGESGAGKSTLSLSLFSAGASWLSDDAVLLREGKAGVEILGLPHAMRMTDATAGALPSLSPLLRPTAPESGRDHEVDPHLAFPDRGLARASGPVTLLFPSIADAPETTLTPLPRAEAFGRLLHSCAWVASEHLEAREAQLALLGRLVEAARAFDVALGRDLLEDPGAVVGRLRTRLSPP